MELHVIGVDARDGYAPKIFVYDLPKHSDGERGGMFELFIDSGGGGEEGGDQPSHSSKKILTKIFLAVHIQIKR